jgi:phage-related holin
MFSVLKMNIDFKKWAIASIMSCLTFIAPAANLIIVIGLLVLSDFVTGVLAARKREEIINSKKMRNSVTKGIGYMVAILVAFMMQKVFIKDFEVMKIVAALIAFIELKSIDENLESLTGKSLFNQFLNKKK